LNIGLDSILFIDDSKFELEEVHAACPEVRVLNAEHYLGLLERSECLVPVTAESRQRRSFYKVEADRRAVAQSFTHDYHAFLRYCEIRLTIRPMTEENLASAYTS
jgi:methoxymalonate biosynthesis protein